MPHNFLQQTQWDPTIGSSITLGIYTWPSYPCTLAIKDPNNNIVVTQKYYSPSVGGTFNNMLSNTEYTWEVVSGTGVHANDPGFVHHVVTPTPVP